VASGATLVHVEIAGGHAKLVEAVQDHLVSAGEDGARECVSGLVGSQLESLPKGVVRVDEHGQKGSAAGLTEQGI